MKAEADAFAGDWLLPSGALRLLVGKARFSAAAVRAFAQEQGVAAGIVVGRLQFEKHLSWAYLNELKVKYVWAHEQAG